MNQQKDHQFEDLLPNDFPLPLKFLLKKQGYIEFEEEFDSASGYRFEDVQQSMNHCILKNEFFKSSQNQKNGFLLEIEQSTQLDQASQLARQSFNNNLSLNIQPNQKVLKENQHFFIEEGIDNENNEISNYIVDQQQVSNNNQFNDFSTQMCVTLQQQAFQLDTISLQQQQFVKKNDIDNESLRSIQSTSKGSYSEDAIDSQSSNDSIDSQSSKQQSALCNYLSSNSSSYQEELQDQVAVLNQENQNDQPDTYQQIVKNILNQYQICSEIIWNNQILAIKYQDFQTKQHLIQQAFSIDLDTIKNLKRNNVCRFKQNLRSHMNFCQVYERMVKQKIKEDLIRDQVDHNIIDSEVNSMFKNLNQKEEYYEQYVLPIRAEITIFFVLYTRQQLRISQKQKNKKDLPEDNSFLSSTCKCGIVYPRGFEKIKDNPNQQKRTAKRSSIINHITKTHKMVANSWMFTIYSPNKEGCKSGQQYSFYEQYQQIIRYIEEKKYEQFHSQIFNYLITNNIKFERIES